MLAAIEGEPGACMSDVCRRTDLPWSTVRHHVATLIGTGQVQARRMGREVRLFPHYLAAHHHALLVVQRLDESKRLLVTLLDVPHASTTWLSDRTGLSRKRLLRCLRLLEQEGWVERIAGVRSPFRATKMARRRWGSGVGAVPLLTQKWAK